MEMTRVNRHDPITFDGHANMVALWAARCAQYGKRTAHREKRLGIWQAHSWAEWFDTSRRIGRALMALGVKRGEPVLILSEDRREWLYIDLAQRYLLRRPPRHGGRTGGGRPRTFRGCDGRDPP